MNEAYKKQAEEWFLRGSHDIETAQLLYDEEGYTDSIAYHIQQAVEKYLKGYLVFHGIKPPKIHELDTLLNIAAEINSDFKDYLDLCEKASKYYIEDRYPPGPPADYSYEEIKKDLEEANDLIKKISQKVK